MARTVRVWLNHWFSTAYHIVNLIKADDTIKFDIIGSSANHDSVVRLVCDEWHIEPLYENDEQYVNFCLDFCQKNNIEVFLPKKGMFAIAKNLDAFNKINVQVLVEKNNDQLLLLNDKYATYQDFQKHSLANIPPYAVLNTVEDFVREYKKIIHDYERACFKFVQDEGGQSFKVIDNSMGEAEGLYKSPGMKITYQDTLNIFKKSKELPAILLMPYLTEQEVSVDCLRTAQGNIMVPRYKTSSRTEEIRYEDEIMELSTEILDYISLDCPCNLQFKYHNNIPYLLEINTRMSGGIQLSCLATKINIPNIAVNKLLGIEKAWKNERTTQKVTHIETPVLL